MCFRFPFLCRTFCYPTHGCNLRGGCCLSYATHKRKAVHHNHHQQQHLQHQLQHFSSFLIIFCLHYPSLVWCDMAWCGVMCGVWRLPAVDPTEGGHPLLEGVPRATRQGYPAASGKGQRLWKAGTNCSASSPRRRSGFRRVRSVSDYISCKSLKVGRGDLHLHLRQPQRRLLKC